MPTQNRRVATYLPKEIDDRLKDFIAERDLKGESQALIVILSEFLGVSQKVAQSVDYSLFVTQGQFNELSAKVSELSEAVQKNNIPSIPLSKLLSSVEQIEQRLELLEAVMSKDSTFSTGELAIRLDIASSTLSHWKNSDSKKGKSPDELLKTTREKDPDGIGWILVPGVNRFKPERKLPSSSPDALQGDLLSAKPLNQVNPLPEGSERSEEG